MPAEKRKTKKRKPMVIWAVACDCMWVDVCVTKRGAEMAACFVPRCVRCMTFPTVRKFQEVRRAR